MSVGDTGFSFSPSGLPNAADLTKARELMRADWHIVTPAIALVDVPYCAGYNEKGDILYIDREVMEFAEIGSRRVNVWEHVCDHEMLEKTILLRYGNEHYAGAHTMATFWEDICLRAYGIDANAYQDWWAPVIAKIGKRKTYPRVPADLDLTPYHDSDDQTTIERMTFVQVNV